MEGFFTLFSATIAVTLFFYMGIMTYGRYSERIQFIPSDLMPSDRTRNPINSSTNDNTGCSDGPSTSSVLPNQRWRHQKRLVDISSDSDDNMLGSPRRI